MSTENHRGPTPEDCFLQIEICEEMIAQHGSSYLKDYWEILLKAAKDELVRLGKKDV